MGGRRAHLRGCRRWYRLYRHRHRNRWGGYNRPLYGYRREVALTSGDGGEGALSRRRCREMWRRCGEMTHLASGDGGEEALSRDGQPLERLIDEGRR